MNKITRIRPYAKDIEVLRDTLPAFCFRGEVEEASTLPPEAEIVPHWPRRDRFVPTDGDRGVPLSQMWMLGRD